MSKYTQSIIIFAVLIAGLIMFPGCEGAGRLDQEVRDKMEVKLKEWNETGFPVKDQSLKESTIGNLKEWNFKYAKLFLVFDTQKAHPVTTRDVLETIGKQWYDTYPGNIKPRFQLEIRAFKDIQSSDAEWGFTKILKDGTPETHWYPTDVY